MVRVSAAGLAAGTVLRCSDADSEVARLQARGLEFGGPVQEAPWGRYATFSHPDGNGWVLQENA